MSEVARPPTPVHACGVERVIKLCASDLVRERVESAEEDLHFPQALVRSVLEEFTSPRDVVLDPFAGYGTTLVVAEQMGRTGIGVELLPERAALIQRRLNGVGRVIEGDARNLADYGLEPVDLCLTSPPYMTAVDHPQNPLTAYRTLDGSYQTYLGELGQVFAAVGRLLRPKGHLVINAATIRTSDVVTPLAWDIARAVAPHLIFRGETYLYWDQPAPWIRGDYCLLFEKQ
jgi:DNA modification methylase